MNIRTVTDPISMHDVLDPEHHPRVYEGDGVNGIEIFFESEANKKLYLDMELEDQKVLAGDDTDDYVAQG